MFDNLRKKKLLESLAVNKVAQVNPPNEPKIKTVQDMKGPSAPSHSLRVNPSMKSPFAPSVKNMQDEDESMKEEMSETPLKEQAEESALKKKDTIQSQKEAMTLGKNTQSTEELRKKKMLAALFAGKK
jgi:hypothetical protein